MSGHPSSDTINGAIIDNHNIHDLFHSKHRNQTSSKIPHFKHSSAKDEHRDVHVRATRCINQQGGLTSLKDWGYHYKHYRIYLCTDIQPFFFFFYFHGIVENKEQEKVPALMLHKEGNFLKAACLNIGSRHYSPFET